MYCVLTFPGRTAAAASDSELDRGSYCTTVSSLVFYPHCYQWILRGSPEAFVFHIITGLIDRILATLLSNQP
jgi:hypothetical protein